MGCVHVNSSEDFAYKTRISAERCESLATYVEDNSRALDALLLNSSPKIFDSLYASYRAGRRQCAVSVAEKIKSFEFDAKRRQMVVVEFVELLSRHELELLFSEVGLVGLEELVADAQAQQHNRMSENRADLKKLKAPTQAVEPSESNSKQEGTANRLAWLLAKESMSRAKSVGQLLLVAELAQPWLTDAAFGEEAQSQTTALARHFEHMAHEKMESEALSVLYENIARRLLKTRAVSPLERLMKAQDSALSAPLRYFISATLNIADEGLADSVATTVRASCFGATPTDTRSTQRVALFETTQLQAAAIIHACENVAVQQCGRCSFDFCPDVSGNACAALGFWRHEWPKYFAEFFTSKYGKYPALMNGLLSDIPEATLRE
jgi:hypothetical protein